MLSQFISYSAELDRTSVFSHPQLFCYDADLFGIPIPQNKQFSFVRGQLRQKFIDCPGQLLVVHGLFHVMGIRHNFRYFVQDNRSLTSAAPLRMVKVISVKCQISGYLPKEYREPIGLMGRPFVPGCKFLEKLSKMVDFFIAKWYNSCRYSFWNLCSLHIHSDYCGAGSHGVSKRF